MAMADQNSIPWKRISVEGAAIVASILLAFAIDAWWEDRLERADERQQLDRLQIEFDANINRIDQFSIIERASEAGREILDQIVDAQGRGSSNIEVSASKIYLLSIAPTYEADTPVLDGLVRSGRLEIVRDARVVMALAAWDRSLRDYLEVAQLARQYSGTLLIPALVKRGDVGLALIGRNTLEANEIQTDPLPAATIAIDDEVKGLIAQKVENVGHAIHLLNKARDAAEEARVALQAARSNLD